MAKLVSRSARLDLSAAWPAISDENYGSGGATYQGGSSGPAATHDCSRQSAVGRSTATFCTKNRTEFDLDI
jgi:hypothetical protein